MQNRLEHLDEHTTASPSWIHPFNKTPLSVAGRYPKLFAAGLSLTETADLSRIFLTERRCETRMGRDQDLTQGLRCLPLKWVTSTLQHLQYGDWRYPNHPISHFSCRGLFALIPRRNLSSVSQYRYPMMVTLDSWNQWAMGLVIKEQGKITFPSRWLELQLIYLSRE